MGHHEVRDVMAADPVTVTPATPLKYVAGSLAGPRDLPRIFASDDTAPRSAPGRDESPTTRGTRPPLASRGLT